MNKKQISEKLVFSKGFLRHETVTVMLAIPANASDITPEKLQQLLTAHKFHTHEIQHVQNAVFG